MKAFDRFLLFFLNIIVLFVSIFLLLLVMNVITNFDPALWIEQVQGADWAFYTVVALSGFTALASLRFIVLSFKRRGRMPASVDQRTDFGDVRISLETLRNLALKSASRTKGAQELKVKVQMQADGLHILIRVFVDGERAITEMTEELQQQVKQHIEDLTGIPVHDVSVFVANLMHTPVVRSSRVE